METIVNVIVDLHNFFYKLERSNFYPSNRALLLSRAKVEKEQRRVDNVWKMDLAVEKKRMKKEAKEQSQESQRLEREDGKKREGRLLKQSEVSWQEEEESFAIICWMSYRQNTCVPISVSAIRITFASILSWTVIDHRISNI